MKESIPGILRFSFSQIAVPLHPDLITRNIMWKVVLLTVIILGIAVAAIAIKMFIRKDGEFKKSCSSVDPATGRRMGCTCGHGEGGESCDNKAGS